MWTGESEKKRMTPGLEAPAECMEMGTGGRGAGSGAGHISELVIRHRGAGVGWVAEDNGLELRGGGRASLTWR